MKKKYTHFNGALIGLLFLAVGGVLRAEDQPAPAPAQNLPAPGEWDGVTEKAKLDRPYEQPLQAYIPFGFTSFFLHPWRAYMDTQPASHFLGSMAFNANTPTNEIEGVLQAMSEAGIRKARFEFGWGMFDWDNHFTGQHRADVIKTLQLAQKYHVRPLMLLNSHHAVPCPIRNLNVQLLADAKKGDRSLKLKPEDAAKIHLGYTGPMDDPDYCAAKPLVIAIQPDGTCQLSGPLMQDIKAGTLSLVELKFLPLHGLKLTGADDAKTAELAASSKATLDGWKQYVQEMCDAAIEALGTKGKADAGFDIEIWNEQTFGSSFLDINNYYDPKLPITDVVTYKKTRPLGPGIRPDAQTEFKEEGAQVLVGISADYVRSRPELAMVKVDDGIGNQWPWNGGGNSWPGEDAFSRHYYTGGWREISPKTINNPDCATINALGGRDGLHNANMPDAVRIVPGSNFIPTVRVGFPEWVHSGFQTESIIRDVLPDSRWGSEATVHGRFTHTGDYHLQQMWETEVNESRGQFFGEFFKQSKLAQDDPKAYALDAYIAGKMTFRQYLMDNHKGMYNIYLFATSAGPFDLGMLEPPFFKALDANKGVLNDAARKELPSYLQGLTWLTKQMEAADPLAATRALRVDELWEYKPRLMYAGDGTPKHPNQWNRDWFAFLPYQLTAGKFLVPYYVVTVDAFKTWQPTKDIADPMRYQMPDQDFDVTIGNCAGTGAKVSVYDPMTNVAVPVSVVADKTSATQLTVRLKTVDYPRFLLIEEAAPGPLIQNPQVTTDDKGTLHIAWNTNIPVSRARVTYGKDWPNRSATEQMVPVSQNGAYSLDVPMNTKGILAARISVSANGLTCAWPRWDEDAQGQVVVPGSTPADVQPLVFNNMVPDTTKAAAQAAPLAADPSVTLPAAKANSVYNYKISLPQGVAFTGAPDDQEAMLDNTSHPVHLRVRYLTGANHSPLESALPFKAVGDEIEKTPVKLLSGNLATMVTMTFMPALHPELGENLAQRTLFIPSGHDNDDLIVVTAEGMPDQMKSADATITSIFASFDVAGGTH